VNRRSSAGARTFVGIVAATVGLVAAGCGSSSHTAASPTTTGAASSATTGGSPASGGASPTSVALSGAPVNIGFLDIEGSLGISFKPQRIVAQQYVDYLNSTGGLNGHPINLITCVTQAASGGADCANELVQKHAILALDYSIIDSASIYPILKSAGIPVFGGGNAPLDAADLTPDGNHWFVGGGALVTYATTNLFIANTFKAKTVGLLVGTSGAAQQAAQNFIKTPLAALGVKTQTVNIQESNPDYTAAIDTVSGTNVLEVLEGAAGVDTAIKQAKALGYKGKLFGALDPTDIAAMGSAATGVYGGLTNVIPDNSNATQPAVKLYLALQQRYGWNWGDVSAYQLVATGINVIKQAGGGTATGLQVRNAFATATNIPIPLGSPTGLTCSKTLSPLAPTACNVQTLLYQVQSGGAVQPVTGQWASPPK
jgi:ABC-type branched-subunit amino acid transport system substrate-binding protein